VAQTAYLSNNIFLGAMRYLLFKVLKKMWNCAVVGGRARACTILCIYKSRRSG